MSKTIDHIVHLGNPRPRAPITEGGEVLGWKPLDGGPDVTAWKVQPDVVEALLAGEKEVRELAALKGAMLAGHVFSEANPSAAEVAIKHVLHCASLHHHEPVSWLSTEDQHLEELLAAILCTAERAPKGTSQALLLAQVEGDPEDHAEILAGIPAHHPTALKTEDGLAYINGNAFGPTQVALAEWVALTANNEAELSTNKALAGEIVTSGLKRKKASCVTTKGVSTITVTFTAAAADVPVEVHKFALLNKATKAEGGTMVLETKITTAAFNAENDNMALTETITTT